MSSDHDPYPTADDDNLVLKIQQQPGAAPGEVDLRVSPDAFAEIRQGLTDSDLAARNVIEESAGQVLEVIATSLIGAGGPIALAQVVGAFIRKNRDKEYQVYANGTRIKLKGLSFRQATRLIAQQTQAATGLEIEPTEN